MSAYVYCPQCRVNKVPPTVSRCGECEVAERAEESAAEHIAALEARVKALEGALRFVGERQAYCVECGDPGTRYFTTEGDGPYWLCDSMDKGHSMPERYAAETEERCDWGALLKEPTP